MDSDDGELEEIPVVPVALDEITAADDGVVSAEGVVSALVLPEELAW